MMVEADISGEAHQRPQIIRGHSMEVLLPLTRVGCRLDGSENCCKI
jgi:hypothetical protein